jgi:CHAT domain-containing protein
MIAPALARRPMRQRGTTAVGGDVHHDRKDARIAAERTMDRRGDRIRKCTQALAIVFLLVALLASCSRSIVAQTRPIDIRGVRATYAAAPRTIEDILTILDQYKPDPQSVQDAQGRAFRPAPKTEDRATLAIFYLERGRAAREIGRLRQAVADLKLGASLAVGVPGEDRLHEEMAVVEIEAGDLLPAIKHTETAIAIAASKRLPGNLMSHYQRLAVVNKALGDLESARMAMTKAEATFADIRRDPRMDYLEHNAQFILEWTRAIVLNAHGKHGEAEAALRRALLAYSLDEPRYQDRLRRFGSRTVSLWGYASSRDKLEQALADSLRLQWRLTEAEAVSRTALVRSLARSGRYSQGTAAGIINLAQILFDQGRFPEADLLAGAAIDIHEHIGTVAQSTRLAYARAVRAAAFEIQGRWQEAIAEFERRRDGLEQDPELARRYGVTHLSWGLALARVGRFDEAISMLESRVETRRRQHGDDAYETAMARGFLALALVARGDRERALSELRRAVPVLVTVMSSRESTEATTSVGILRLRQFIEAYIDLLLQRGYSADLRAEGLDPLDESFRLADVARGSSVQRAVTASVARAAIADRALADLARQDQDSQQRLAALNELRNRVLAAPPDQQIPRVIADLSREIDNLHATRRTLRQDIERQFPKYASLVNPTPPSIERAQMALHPGEALISIYVGADRTYVWAIPYEGTPAVAAVPLGESAIERIVAELRRSLAPGTASVAEYPKVDLALAHKLYHELLRPVESGWKFAKSLVIVAHGPLGQLPFAVLVTVPMTVRDRSLLFAGYKEVPWLIRTAAITHVPSVSAFTTLRAVQASAEARRPFIGFGDPYFNRQQAEAATKDEGIQMATSRVRLRDLVIPAVPMPLPGEDFSGVAPSRPPAPLPANSTTLAQLRRLPDTADEIIDIARTLNADRRTDVYLGVEANEKNVKTLNLADRKIVAFATHGLVPGDLNGLDQPALALTAPDVAGIDGDGLLTMEEILELKLNADWVLLSACNTAKGQGAGSEAVSGLGRAFFYAGARALLVSHWPVETTSARLLTTTLFKLQANDPALSRADALRQTMLAVIDDHGAMESDKPVFSYAHPMFWAPFALVGDGAGH